MKINDKTFDRIRTLAAELNAIYAEIDLHREEWHQNVKSLIKKTFKSVIKKSKLHLLICQYDHVLNLESIQLTFGILNSGLLIEPKKGKNAIPSMVLLKRGGLLAYSLMANGKVSVAIQYPYIEEIYGDPENVRELGTFSPADITREMILDHVQTFLEEIVKWEREEKKLIGFHLKKNRK